MNNEGSGEMAPAGRKETPGETDRVFNYLARAVTGMKVKQAETKSPL
jgi:hypothetical protein